MTDVYWLPIVMALVALAFVVVVAFALHRRSRDGKVRNRLRAEFGPEFDRAVDEYGGVRRAQRELLARKRRVRGFHVHPLQAAEHEHFARRWTAVQSQFVDDPVAAVENTHELVKQVMVARGYPLAQFDQRVKDLSVDHPRVVEHYRAARALFEQNHGASRDWNTEELRQAMVHYRILFAELLEEPVPRYDHAMHRAQVV